MLLHEPLLDVFTALPVAPYDG